MKFIHTSDWHLGRSFHHVSLIDDQAFILDQLLDYLARHPDIEAVIVSGDIYDRSVPPTAAIELLDRVVNTICHTLRRQLIMIPGNHDSATRLGFASSHMSGSGLHILSSIESIETPVTLRSNQGEEVEFYAIPYVDPEFIRNHFGVSLKEHDAMYQFLTDRITQTWETTCPKVLLAHCFVDGADESESERPLSIGGLDKVNPSRFSAFDYVALGHLHQPQKRLKDSIRYSGSLLKYSFSEHQQVKSLTIVEMNQHGLVGTESLSFAPLRDVRVIEGELDAIIGNAKDDTANDDYFLIRLTDHHAILDPMEKLRAVYPNVLHIEKPGLYGERLDVPSTQQLKRGEFEMFCDFYKEIQGRDVTDEQAKALKDLIYSLQTTQDDSE